MEEFDLRDDTRALKDRIRTIIFDLDGTLVFHEPDSFDMISTFCTKIGQPLDAETERQGRRKRHKYFVDPNILKQLNGFSRDEFWCHFNRYLLKAIGIHGDLDRLAKEATEQFANTELTYRCSEADYNTLAELRFRGYTVGLITNRSNVLSFQNLLDDMGLRPYFDLTLASGEVGVRKPQAEIFDIAIDRLGARADQSVYVGDNYWADVVGAEQAGITPILYDPLRLFPEAECQILERLDQLLSWLP
jgi:HAD superfamily hydrolase (TIGR01549 family)